MTRNAVLASALLLAAACSTTTPPPQDQPRFQTVRVDLSRFNGRSAGTVNADGQPVTAWVRGNEAGYTEDKKPIVGVTFSGAPDDDGVSVTVAALVNDGTTIPVGTYRVGPGQAVSVDLSRFGMPPMGLRGVVRTAEQ